MAIFYPINILNPFSDPSDHASFLEEHSFCYAKSQHWDRASNSCGNILPPMNPIYWPTSIKKHLDILDMFNHLPDFSFLSYNQTPERSFFRS